MKKYIFLAILLFCFNFMNVNAATYAPNSCIDDNSCIAVCSYTNKFDVTRIMTIYYHFNGEWSVSYWNGIGDIGEDMYYGGIKGPNAFGNVFSSSGSPNIYWEVDDITSSNFRCPDHAYFDRQAFTEMCFSDDSETCENKSGWFATKFGKEDSAFQYDEKNYDFEDDIENYAQWIFGDIKEEISNGEFNVEDEIYEKIAKDFQTNYLNGNTVPPFIINSEAYQNLYEIIEEEFNNAKQEEINNANQDLEDGNITQEEHDTIVNNWENVDIDTVVENAQQALNDIQRDSIQNNLEWEVNSCDSILGSTSNPNEPAYYLNFAFNILKYAAIVILFVFTVLDFAKAVASSDNDALKKALQKAVKRLIICVIIFFLPNLINFVLNLLGIVDNPTCGIGVN